MTISAATSSQQRQIFSLVGAIAAAGIVLLLPTPEGLSVQGHRMAALFIGILVLWATEALPIAVTSLLALALQPLFRLTTIVVPPNPNATPGQMMGAAAASFISNPFFFVLVMFFIAFAWIKSGLAQRFALWMISLAGTDAKRAIYVFVVGTGLISTVVSDVPAAVIFMAIALGIFEKLNIRPGSNFGKRIDDGHPDRSLIGGVGTPAGSSINLLGLSMIEANGGARVPFLHWMAIGIPMIAILLPFAALGARAVLSAGNQDDRRARRHQPRAPGTRSHQHQGTQGDRVHGGPAGALDLEHVDPGAGRSSWSASSAPARCSCRASGSSRGKRYRTPRAGTR